jgi:hypothetical protein
MGTMTERLEDFRKRLRGSEKNADSWKSWVGSPTAWIALALSLATAFYTFVYHSDELSVVFDNVDVVGSLDTKKFTAVKVMLPKAITFVNSGSRPVTVTKFGILVAQRWTNKDRPDCSSLGTTFEYDLEPTVIKPYDTVSKNVRLTPSHSEKNIEDLNVSGINLQEQEWFFAACGKFSFVTQDSAIWHRVIRLDLLKMSPGDVLAARNRLNNSDVPQVLIKRSRFWTSVSGDERT